MEDPQGGSLITSRFQRHDYVGSNVFLRHLHRQFQSVFQLPRISASELPVQQIQSDIYPVSPADALTAAAEDLRKNMVQKKKFISEVEIQEFLTSETGWSRLKRMYTKDVDGFHSPELWFIGESLLKICGMTFIVTSYIGGQRGKDKFIKNNQATAFRTRFQASRLMTDQTVLAGMKSGFIWAYRVGIFSSIFLLLSQSIAVYRNKSSILEYVIASGVTGSFLKANLGPKGMVSGGVFGSIMGLFGGSLIYGFMLLTNETQEQRHYWNIQKYLEVKRELQSGQD